ncbi:hypothetical protein [Shewanella marina]|uniref:hypothetical protein n=1 Tax=Shewanella marina TaxID=487319 RepID=UPI00047274BD|nr:hypothetical protein [Shewanella marina]
MNLKFMLVGLVCLLSVQLLTGCHQDQTIDEALQPKKTASSAIVATFCNFYDELCIQTIAGNEVSLTMSQANTPSETPLSATITSQLPVTNIKMTLSGRDMFMGVIPTQITRIADRVYESEFIYGSCSSGNMIWRAKITLTVAGKDLYYYFDFKADNNRT